MTAEQILESNRDAIESLCRRYHVKRLRLFGSSITEQWNVVTSDFDFLVEYGPESNTLPPLDRLVGLQLDLEELLDRKVDAIDWNAARNPIFKENAERTAKLFYAA